jgi:hypothetical protein
VRLLLCISDSDPVRCARLCPRMLRAASMASKCAPGAIGDSLLSRSCAQLQMLLHTLAASACGEAEYGSDKEDGGLGHVQTTTVRKGTKRRRFRSRNSVLDNWLADDKVGRFAADAIRCLLTAVDHRRRMTLLTIWKIFCGSPACRCSCGDFCKPRTQCQHCKRLTVNCRPLSMIRRPLLQAISSVFKQRQYLLKSNIPYRNDQAINQGSARRSRAN